MVNWIGVREAVREVLLCIPGGGELLRRWRLYRFHRHYGGNPSSQEVFTTHYQANSWGSAESLSGPGSTVEYTANIRREIPLLAQRLGIRVLLDAPCGDFNWFRLVSLPEGVRYVGGDIVAWLIERNQRVYGNQKVTFVHLDVTQGLEPAGIRVSDGIALWLCRDLLFHFSNRHIFATVDHFLRSPIGYLLTSSHTDCSRNSDIPTGSFRLLNLELPPYCFGPPLEAIEDYVEGWPRRKLCLWDRDTLKERLADNRAMRRALRG